MMVATVALQPVVPMQSKKVRWVSELEPQEGFEPATVALRGRRTANRDAAARVPVGVDSQLTMEL